MVEREKEREVEVEVELEKEGKERDESTANAVPLGDQFLHRHALCLIRHHTRFTKDRGMESPAFSLSLFFHLHIFSSYPSLFGFRDATSPQEPQDESHTRMGTESKTTANNCKNRHH